MDQQIKELEAEAKVGTATLTRPQTGGEGGAAGRLKIEEVSDDGEEGMAF